MPLMLEIDKKQVRDTLKLVTCALYAVRFVYAYVKRYKKAIIRKRCNQKEISTPKTEMGKKLN